MRMRSDGRRVAFIQLVLGGPVAFRGLFTVGVTTGSAVKRVADEISGGWLGNRLMRQELDPEIGEFAREKICLLASNDDFACEREVAIDPSRDLIDPEGSPDGRFVVATAVPAGAGVFRDGGRIELFLRRTEAAYATWRAGLGTAGRASRPTASGSFSPAGNAFAPSPSPAAAQSSSWSAASPRPGRAERTPASSSRALAEPLSFTPRSDTRAAPA